MVSLPQEKIKVAVLGATGTVGQRFIQLLSAHPYFQLHALGASSRSAGKPYGKVTKWKLTKEMPAEVRDLVVQECKPEAQGFKECAVIFSGLDAEVAGEIEHAFRSADLAVFSNAKNYRRDETVPLIVPLVNTSHLSVIPHQRKQHSLDKGFIVTNANCSTTGLVVPLAALEQAFGPLKTVVVTTLQAISGGGYPGVPSLDILDNVVPHIGGEEEKIEWEAAKILGGVKEDNTGFTYHAENPMVVSAACNRVAVVDGHTACVSIKFAGSKPSLEEIKKALNDFTCEAQQLGKELVPSAPAQVITVREEEDRPQPRLDRDAHEGAGVSVGRIRDCPVLDYKFVCLVHNTFLGAATSSVINAEVAVAKGVIKV